MEQIFHANTNLSMLWGIYIFLQCRKSGVSELVYYTYGYMVYFHEKLKFLEVNL